MVMPLPPWPPGRAVMASPRLRATRASNSTISPGVTAFERGRRPLDVIVSKVEGQDKWTLTDLLGRPMGRILGDGAKNFTIVPDGNASETMAGMLHGPHPSLDSALKAIETHTRGVCRHTHASENATEE